MSVDAVEAMPIPERTLHPVPLSQLRAGQTGTITSLDAACDPSICHRLQLLGFSAGREISKIRQAPLGGPMVFRVCDVHMCLRRAQAEMIMVTVDDPGESCPLPRR